MGTVGNGERERSVFQTLWERSLRLRSSLDRFHRAAVSTAWPGPESGMSTSPPGTGFWKSLGWTPDGGVASAVGRRSLGRTTQVEVPPLSFFLIQTSLPGWCLEVALLVDVVVWMILDNLLNR